MSSSTKLLQEYIKDVVSGGRRGQRLWVFDFDDTLVKTDSRTHVTNAAGEKFDLTPGELAIYDKQPGDVFDYTDFEKLVNPREVKWMNRILRNVYTLHGPESVAILSARGHAGPIREWLSIVGLNDIEIAVLGDTSPEMKADWVSARVSRDKLITVEFFDDSHKNVAAVRELRYRHPGVLITARHIIHSRIASLRN